MALLLNIQLRELPLVADHQLAWLRVKKDCRVHLGAYLIQVELFYYVFIPIDTATSKSLELHNNTANFGKVGFYFIWVGCSVNKGSPRMAKVTIADSW